MPRPIPNYYHGTSSQLVPLIKTVGLHGGQNHGVFLTDSLIAAQAYAEQTVRREGGEPVILAVSPEPMTRQQNGSPAPPYFFDDWHRDSGMDGSAWEYDAAIPPSAVTIIHQTN